jgi:hypothetical protein
MRITTPHMGFFISLFYVIEGGGKRCNWSFLLEWPRKIKRDAISQFQESISPEPEPLIPWNVLKML